MAIASALITKFQNSVDDSLDSDYMYQLLNDAKDEVEAMNAWEQLKKSTTYSVASGYSYTSALGALPTRFIQDIRMVEDDSDLDYYKVPLDDRSAQRYDTLGYFLDLANGNVHLTGENHQAKTMYLYYIGGSADLTASDEWAFPARFHSILVYKMAEIYYSADAGEKGRAWDDRWSAQFERELNRMYAWNDSLKMRNRPRVMRAGVTPKNVGYGRS